MKAAERMIKKQEKLAGVNFDRIVSGRGRLLAAMSLAVLASACGGGGSSPESVAGAQSQNRIVEGGFTKNAVAGADIAAYSVDDAGMIDGAAIATTITDAQGGFMLQLPTGSGMLLLRTAGGEFIDESDREPDPARKRRIQFAPDEGLEAILPAGATQVAITIPGQALLEKARREAAGSGFPGFYAANAVLATQAFGFDIATTLPADTINPNTATTLAQRQYAMMLGGFANVLNRVSLTVGLLEPNIAAIDAVIADFSDGRIDGLVAGNPVMVTIGQVPVALPTNLRLNDEITRFRNNNFDAYVSTSMAAVDENIFSQGGTPNMPPVAVDDSYLVNEGDTLSVVLPGVLENDTDPDNDPLFVSLDLGPTHGQLSLEPDGSFVYNHNGSETTLDSFDYSVDDGQGNSASATVTIDIVPVNDPPIATDDTFDVAEGGLLDIPAPGLLDNDSDVENDTLTSAVDTPPANGQLSLADDGSFSYTHNGSETLSDVFIYSVSDGQGGSATASVNITVMPVNDSPIAITDNYSVAEGDTLVVAVPGVLLNDMDAENDTLDAVLQTPPTNGQLALQTNGSFSYAHNGEENVTDSFTYTVSDANGGSATGMVNLTISPVNDDPVAVADSYTVSMVGGTLISDPGVLDNDTDPENDALSASVDTPPSNGQLMLGADGIFTYTHDGSDVLTDSFSYVASDGNGGSAAALVSLTILSGPTDSDGDGLPDSDEMAIGTDPNNPDSDMDGATDFEEVNIDGDPSSANVTPGGDTNPLDPDTENDNVGDGVELDRGTDPHVVDPVLYVSAINGNDSNDGSTWATAIQTNGSAIGLLAQLASITYVLYEPGVYSQMNLATVASPEFHLVGSVGPGIYLPAFPPNTFFDGANDGTVLVFDDAPTASVSNITLINGSHFAGGAGGIDIFGSSFVVLDKLVISDNVSSQSAGGVFIGQSASVDILDSFIANNSNDVRGSAVLVEGNILMEGSIIANNFSAGGGAVTLDQSLNSIADFFGNKFLSNSGVSGALEIISTSSTIFDDNLMVGNYATEIGGAINAIGLGSDMLALDMELNTIAYNQADGGAGGYAGLTGCDNFSAPKRFAGNIFYFNDDAIIGFDDNNDNVFVEESVGAVCGPDARASFEALVVSAGDTLVDFESVATGTNLTTQIPGVSFASISDVNGNPVSPIYVEVSNAFAGSNGNTIVGSPCNGCTDDGRIRYEIVLDTPQRRVGLQRIWNEFTVTRFFDVQGQLLHEFAGGPINGGDYQFVGYVAASPDPATWVKRVEIDGEISGTSRQVGYTDNLFYGSADVDAEFGLGENLFTEFNLVQGGPVSATGLAADPLFVAGFYLDQLSSPAVDGYTTVDVSQVFDGFETTDPLGAPDSGILDLGYHNLRGAQPQPDGVGPNAFFDSYLGEILDIEFMLRNGQTDLGEPAQLVGVCMGSGTTLPGAAIESLTTLDPVPGCSSVLAVDMGDGRYRIRAGGDLASGDIVLDVYVNGTLSPVSMTATFVFNPP